MLLTQHSQLALSTGNSVLPTGLASQQRLTYTPRTTYRHQSGIRELHNGKRVGGVLDDCQLSKLDNLYAAGTGSSRLQVALIHPGLTTSTG